MAFCVLTTLSVLAQLRRVNFDDLLLKGKQFLRVKNSENSENSEFSLYTGGYIRRVYEIVSGI